VLLLLIFYMLRYKNVFSYFLEPYKMFEKHDISTKIEHLKTNTHRQIKDWDIRIYVVKTNVAYVAYIGDILPTSQYIIARKNCDFFKFCIYCDISTKYHREIGKYQLSRQFFGFLLSLKRESRRLRTKGLFTITFSHKRGEREGLL
jgi:hypothetical protein